MESDETLAANSQDNVSGKISTEFAVVQVGVSSTTDIIMHEQNSPPASTADEPNIQVHAPVLSDESENGTLSTKTDNESLPLQCSLPITGGEITTSGEAGEGNNNMKLSDNENKELAENEDHLQKMESASVPISDVKETPIPMEVESQQTEGSPTEEKTEQVSDTGITEEEKIDETASPNSTYYYWQYDLSAFSTMSSPSCLKQTDKSEFKRKLGGSKGANYLKGCKWAPDGSCLLSCSDDDTLRLFNIPSSFSPIQDWNTCNPQDLDLDKEEWRSTLQVKEGGLVYDYCWYPLMSCMDPATSCFLATSSLSPIHLWDAFTGTLRASYHPYNHLDQVISAYSLAFGMNGDTIYSGFEKCIRIFNLTRPGRECIERKLKQPLSDLNQYGIIASITVNPALQSFYALGSFDKTVGLYYEDGSVICLLQGHTGGVTHMKFSSDGMKLFTGGRKDSRLMCWDMRQMGEAYRIFDRVVDNHQRIYFDVSADDRYLVTGGTDGIVKIWDILGTDDRPTCSFEGSSDCVNGISLNPFVPLLATSSGQRHIPDIVEDSDDEDLFMDSEGTRKTSCDIKLWKLT